MQFLPGGGAHALDHGGVRGERERGEYGEGGTYADRDVRPLRDVGEDGARVSPWSK